MRRNVVKSYKVLTSVDMSSDQSSNSLEVTYTDIVGCIVEWSGGDGTTAGIMLVEVQNGDSAWSSLTLSTTPVVSGASGNLVINISSFSFEKMRFTYKRTSGTGTLTATISTKAVGS